MTDTSYARIPAGWYPDPRGSRQRRWWDGSSWTHALEALPETAVAAPAYANLPGPKVARVPSPSAPTVARAIDAEPTEHFPTRRQLRDAATVLETQKQFGSADQGSPAAPRAVAPVPVVAPVSAVSAVAPVSAVSAVSPVSTATPVPALTAVPALTPESEQAAPSSPAAEAPANDTAPVAAKAFDPDEFANPVIPVNPSAQAAKALAAATAAARERATGTSSGAFVPVMRTGAPTTLQNDLEYQPFGMTPRITTGVVESPTSVNTGSVWVLTSMPVLFLGSAFAIIALAPEFYTQFIQVGLAFVVLMASFALAIRDRHQLTVRSHQSTASPAWIFLSPLAYLVARAAHTRRQAGRGWAPAIVFVVVSAAAAAALYFSPLPLTAFFAPAG
jgi:hypothetical protein